MFSRVRVRVRVTARCLSTTRQTHSHRLLLFEMLVERSFKVKQPHRTSMGLGSAASVVHVFVLLNIEHMSCPIAYSALAAQPKTIEVLYGCVA